MMVHSSIRGRYFRELRGGLRFAVAVVIFTVPCGWARGEEDPSKSLGPPGWLGLAIDDSLVPGRLVVVEVDASGPAAKAGVRIQDMVLAIDGEPTLDAERFAAAIATIGPGDTVRFSIGRGGTVEEIALTADEPPPAPPRSAFGEPSSPSPLASGQPPSPFPPEIGPATSGPAATPVVPQPAGVVPPSVSVPAFSEPRLPEPKLPEPKPAQDRWQGSTGSVPPGRTPPPENGRGKTALGVRTVPVDPVVQARYSLPEPIGALVVGLVEDLPASRAGLPTGSVIVAFDRQPVRSPTELTKLVSAGPTDRPVKLEYILPGGESRAADVSLVSVDSLVSEDGAGNGIGAEIRELRRTIESLTKRLDELERRALETR